MTAREELPPIVLKIMDTISNFFMSGNISDVELAILKDHINSLQQVATARTNLTDPGAVSVEVTHELPEA